MSSDVDLNSVGLLKRREIEARILAPILESFAAEFGRDRVLSVARRAIEDVARRQGQEFAAQLGSNRLEDLRAVLDSWCRDDALQLTVLNGNARSLDFDVTTCRYAELYRSLGLEEAGAILSCSRDAAFAEGFNPAIRLQRSQTILGGCSSCDFRFRLEEQR